MSRKVVHVIGTGTIGEPLIGLLCDFKNDLGIDQITFHKNTPLTTDRSKVVNLVKRGARLSTHNEKFDGFINIGLKPEFATEEALERASVVIDCTPSTYGLDNKEKYYNKFSDNTLGFISQGSEFGFGKPYARGINDEALVRGEDQFIQVVSCNTHNLCTIVKTMALDAGEDNLIEGKFLLIRRSNDVSQSKRFVPAPEVGLHKDPLFGTHHARDASLLFETLGKQLPLFSSAMKVNSQLMHILYFSLKLKRKTSLQEIIGRLEANDRISVTDKVNANEVFSFGRDHGHFGRILNQTVVSLPSLHLSKDNQISGFCFTPQDGNSLLSSISAAEWFMFPNSFEEKIQCLKPFFFDEV